MDITEQEEFEFRAREEEERIQQTKQSIKPYRDIIGEAASKITSIGQMPSPLEQATSKTVNQAKNIINSGLFGIPEKISKETFKPKGLSPQEEITGGLMGGQIIGGAVIGETLKGIQKLYSIPAIKTAPMIEKAVESVKKILPKDKSIITEGALKASDEKIALGLNSIYKHKEMLQYGDDVGRMPRNINEAVAAANQTKSNIYEQYTKLREAAGESASIDFVKAAQKLRAEFTGEASKIATPEIRRYALKKINQLLDYGRVDLKTAEDVIKKNNALLQPFYGKPIGSIRDASKLSVDALFSKAIREELDDVILQSTGKSYQALKRAYGSVVELEKNFVTIADKLAKTNQSSSLGTIDTVPILYGAFTGNVPLVASGLLQKFAQTGIKSLRNPDTIVRNVFGALDKSGQKTFYQSFADMPLKGLASPVIGSIINKEKKHE